MAHLHLVERLGNWGVCGKDPDKEKGGRKADRGGFLGRVNP